MAEFALDYRATPNTVVGFALAGGTTNWSLAKGLGGGSSDVFQLGLHGATRAGAAYLSGGFAYSSHWLSTDRFAFAGDHLTARFNAESLGARVEGGYRFRSPVCKAKHTRNSCTHCQGSQLNSSACLLLAHHVDPGIDRDGRHRRVTGPPCEIGKTAAHEA